jgi:acetyl-CoA C-acetyltransferase
VRDRNGVDTSLVDDVVLGCVMPGGEHGSDIAGIAALVAGYDRETVDVLVNRFCASGLEACTIAAAKVATGEGGICRGRQSGIDVGRAVGSRWARDAHRSGLRPSNQP